ncbi:MAG: hypothetical protein ACO4AC_06745 [Pseudohongiellaceae bacterium]|jgi:hypothetical protein
MNKVVISIEDKETLMEYIKSALSTLAILVVPVLALWASFA